MILKLKHIFFLVIVTIFFHFIFNFYNLYSVAKFDLILHVLAGIVYGLIAIFYFQKKYNKRDILVKIILFSLLGSILWELIEYGFLIFFTKYALLLDIYSSSLLEALIDILAGLVGGIILSLVFWKSKQLPTP